MKVRKSCRRASLLILTGTALALPGEVRAFFDNFNDGDDTAPIAPWLQSDPIQALTSVPHNMFTFPGGNRYRLQGTPAAGQNPPEMGISRVGSAWNKETYDDFYISVDLVAWDESGSPGNPGNNIGAQAMSILARGTDVGVPGTTSGYSFGVVVFNPSFAGAGSVDYVTLKRIANELRLEDVAGAKDVAVPLDPANDYRLVFIGKGSYLEGRIYQLPDLTTPIAVICGKDTTFVSGSVGLLGFNVANSAGAQFQGNVDATYDNFFVANHADIGPDGNTGPQIISDNFNDGNDTTPAPAWLHVDPLGGVGIAPPATYNASGGVYRIVAPNPLSFDAGTARTESLRPDQVYKDFYLSVDVVDWDDTVHQLFGLAARINTPGLGTTGGYIFSWENGNLGPTSGDMDILRIRDEGGGEATQIEQAPSQSTAVHLNSGTDYRFVFKASGTNFEGQVYELPDTINPIKRVYGWDDTDLFQSGICGLVVVDHPSPPDNGATATFDNYYSAAASEPRLAIERVGSGVRITWPANQTGIWVLESASQLGPGAVWTEVECHLTAGLPVGGKRVYIVASPVGTSFYRLKKV